MFNRRVSKNDNLRNAMFKELEDGISRLYGSRPKTDYAPSGRSAAQSWRSAASTGSQWRLCADWTPEKPLGASAGALESAPAIASAGSPAIAYASVPARPSTPGIKFKVRVCRGANETSRPFPSLLDHERQLLVAAGAQPQPPRGVELERVHARARQLVAVDRQRAVAHI